MAAFASTSLSVSLPNTLSGVRVSAPRHSVASRVASGVQLRATSSLTVRAVLVEPLVEDELPTPDVPSTRMMADFLMTYGRMPKHVAGSGDAVAAAGANVLERVKVGVRFLIRGSQTAQWQRDEMELQACLLELQKDISLIERYHGQPPAKLAVQMASLRCIEAARLLQRL